MLVTGCTQAAETQTNETTTASAAVTEATTVTTTTTTVTEAVTTTTSAATTATTTAPRIPAEVLTPEDSGLDITHRNGWVYVYIPADYTDENIGEYFRRTEWVVYVPDENSMFRVLNGALYNKELTRLYAVPSWCEDEETKNLPSPQKAFTVPAKVEWIAPNAFHMITSERPLIYLYLHGGITEENKKELVLWGGTFVIRK